MAAVTASWAKENAEIQTLVDKVLADQKALQASQTALDEAISAFVQAGRGTDADALAAARKNLEGAMQKAAADERAAAEDVRALSGKMKELNPNRDRQAAPKTAAPDGSPEPKPRIRDGSPGTRTGIRDDSPAGKAKGGVPDAAPRTGAREGG